MVRPVFRASSPTRLCGSSPLLPARHRPAPCHDGGQANPSRDVRIKALDASGFAVPVDFVFEQADDVAEHLLIFLVEGVEALVGFEDEEFALPFR